MKHLSPTSIDLYCKCGVAWEYRYVRKVMVPPGCAALRGTAVHVGSRENFAQKIASHRDLSASQIKECAAAAFESAADAGVLLTPEERSEGKAKVLARHKDQAASLAGLYAAQVAPRYQPIFTEQRVTIPVSDQLELLGYIDCADDQDRVIDLKTGRRLNRTDLEFSTQLVYYGAAYEVATGRASSVIRVENLVANKSPDLNTLETRVDAGHFRWLQDKINRVLACINAGVFHPAPPGAWWRSEKWCGYCTMRGGCLSKPSGARSRAKS